MVVGVGYGVLRGFLQLAVFLCIVALFPLLLRPLTERQDAGSKRTQQTELTKEQEVLREANPEVLFVGNSMVFTRIDRREFSNLSGRDNHFLTNAGSASACWYLYLKNIIGPSGIKPEMVFIFFRDQMLTWPEFRTESYFAAYVESLQLPEEPVVSRVLNASKTERQGARYHFTKGVNALYGINGQPERFQSTIRDLAMDVTPLGSGKRPRRMYMNGVFHLENLRRDLGAGDIVGRRADEAPIYFSASPEVSFLPHMLDVVEELGLKVCFYRVKKRMDVNGTRPDSPYVEAYLGELQKYLKERGALYIDETGDEISEAWYGDGDHIARDKRTVYTQFFWEKVKEVLPAKP